VLVSSSDLYTRARALPLAQRFSRSAFASKVTKYAIGSAIALLTSVVVFALAYVILSGHPTTCSILAFFAGAIPNWILNRRWAWKMTGRADFLREIVAYIAISGVVLVASSVSTGAMQSWVKVNVTPHHGIRVILVTGAYVFVQAVLFVLKFLIYEKWVFSGQSRLRAAVRSRHQVWSAARANRTP
jgi:putative flippase GtrA